jgi:hypothetical protein
MNARDPHTISLCVRPIVLDDSTVTCKINKTSHATNTKSQAYHLQGRESTKDSPYQVEGSVASTMPNSAKEENNAVTEQTVTLKNDIHRP